MMPSPHRVNSRLPRAQPSSPRTTVIPAHNRLPRAQPSSPPTTVIPAKAGTQIPASAGMTWQAGMTSLTVITVEHESLHAMRIQFIL
jgi:hypothetical protein